MSSPEVRVFGCQTERLTWLSLSILRRLAFGMCMWKKDHTIILLPSKKTVPNVTQPRGTQVIHIENQDRPIENPHTPSYQAH